MRRNLGFNLTIAGILASLVVAPQLVGRVQTPTQAAGVVTAISQDVHAYADPEKDGTPVPVACDGSQTTSLPRIISDTYITASAATEVLWSFTFGVMALNRQGVLVPARAWDQTSRRSALAAGVNKVAGDTQMFKHPLPLPAGTYFFTVHVFEGPSDTCMFHFGG